MSAITKFSGRVESNELTLYVAHASILILVDTHKMAYVPGLGGPASGKKKTKENKEEKVRIRHEATF